MDKIKRLHIENAPVVTVDGKITDPGGVHVDIWFDSPPPEGEDGFVREKRGKSFPVGTPLADVLAELPNYETWK